MQEFLILFLPQVGSDKQPSPKGQVVPYPPHDGFDRKTNKHLPIKEMKGENILLPLPQGRFQVNYTLQAKHDVSHTFKHLAFMLKKI